MVERAARHPDDSLAARIYTGDADAEVELIERFTPGLKLILKKRTAHNPYAIEDMLNETLWAVITRLRTIPLEDPSKLAHFVHRTAINIASSDFRRFKRQSTHPDTDAITALAGESLQPEQRIDQARTASLIRQFLNELRVERDREILTRYYLEDQDKQEICEALDLSTRHFDRVLLRAKARLRKIVIQDSNLDETL